jgi:hypothetical protein
MPNLRPTSYEFRFGMYPMQNKLEPQCALTFPKVKKIETNIIFIFMKNLGIEINSSLKNLKTKQDLYLPT